QELVWWQWIALPVLFGLAIAAGHLLGYVTRRLLSRVAQKARARWNNEILARFHAPLTLGWALVAVYLVSPSLGLYPPAPAFIERVVRGGFFLALFWFAIRGIDVVSDRALDLPGARGNPAARSLVPLGGKAVKIAVISIAVVQVLSELGYPVASLIAGLGLSG